MPPSQRERKALSSLRPPSVSEEASPYQTSSPFIVTMLTAPVAPRTRFAHLLILSLCLVSLGASTRAFAQAAPEKSGASLIDDKKARALIEAGDARMDVGELTAGIDLYKAMLDRYPTSRWRFLARLKIGKQFLSEKKFELALDQFRRVSVEDNTEADQIGEASLQIGICYFEMGKYEETFSELRKVIRNHPGTPYSNDAYYYIGQAHYKLGRYGNAIDAFKNVGTSIDVNADSTGKLDAGKRLFVKIEDRDLSAQAGDRGLDAAIATTSGDKENITCYAIAQGAPILMGSLRTQLGEPIPGDGILQVIGTDKITVTTIDQQTAGAQLNVPRVRKIEVVGNARVKIVDGAFAEQVGAVVLEKPVFLLIQDADRDTSGKADTIEAIVRTKRLVETDAPVANAEDATSALNRNTPVFKTISERKITLTEQATPNKTSVHTGVFTGVVPLGHQTETTAEGELVGQINDILEIEYTDQVSSESEPVAHKSIAKVIEGNLNPLQVANTQISDEELKFKTALKTSDALKNIGNIYKDLGLSRQATEKYKQALAEAEQVAKSYGALNQRLLEQTYVQMWKIYYAMDDLNHAAQMCLELQRRFPESPFVDEALLLMGQVRQKQGKFQEAIGVYRRLAAVKNSPMAPAAQYAVGECYEQMGNTTRNKSYYDQAFLAFKDCYEKFPNSNQAGDSLSKMAEYYYSKDDFTRALDLYDEALAQYQDSKFIDVVLYNYGRTLVKMKRLDDAAAKFNQLISTYPNSAMVGNAQKLVEAIQKHLDRS